ncbi:hypothetical protein [Arthrobacter sp. A5]|uniref:hypothetical protein n=1 Tax=Arthrobacter sp. A5 TaxID=576926 RepID=UPI003DA93BC2
MRWLEPVRAGYGLCQLVFPDVIPGLLLRHRLDDRAAAVVRVLGFRHVLQALVVGLAPLSPALHRCGAVVDGLHSASMFVLGAVDARRRPAALSDAVVAGLFFAAELRSERTDRAMPAHPSRQGPVT